MQKTLKIRNVSKTVGLPFSVKIIEHTEATLARPVRFKTNPVGNDFFMMTTFRDDVQDEYAVVVFCKYSRNFHLFTPLPSCDTLPTGCESTGVPVT